MTPLDAEHGGFEFELNNNSYFIGLFSIENPEHPGILYPALLRKEAAGWVEIDKRQALWNDIQEDVTPGLMATHIIKDFNVTLEAEVGTPMTWNQKLAAIFRLRLALVNNQLEITP